jgi:beta-N-acetylhexosaminidase
MRLTNVTALGGTVRVWAIGICTIFLPAFVLAGSASEVTLDRSAIVYVEDESVGVKLSQDECLQYGIRYGYPECAVYRKRIVVRKQYPDKSEANVQHQGQPANRIDVVKASTAKSGRQAISNPLLPRKGESAKERLHRMIGQLVLVGFDGREPADEGVVSLQKALQHGDVSGAIVKDENVSDPRQLRDLLAALGEASSQYPALLAADQPGGPDSVLPEEKGFNSYSSASAIGGSSRVAAARSYYRAMGIELAGLGLNMNIGPSADPCRDSGIDLSASCFAWAPHRVAALAAAFNTGHHEAGVLTALHHAVDRRGQDGVGAKEAAAQAMISRLLANTMSDAVVLRVRASDAAFALRPLRGARMQKGFVRNDSGAKLVIVDLVIDRPRAPLRYGDIFLKALDAGADMILVRNPSDIPGDVPAALADMLASAVASKRIPSTRIEEAFERVQRMKAHLLKPEPRTEVAHLQ